MKNIVKDQLVDDYIKECNELDSLMARYTELKNRLKDNKLRSSVKKELKEDKRIILDRIVSIRYRQIFGKELIINNKN